MTDAPLAARNRREPLGGHCYFTRPIYSRGMPANARVITPCIQDLRRHRPFALVAVTTVLLFAQATSDACADAAVSGSMDLAQVEARHSSVEEVLNALSKVFPIRYRTSIELSHAVSGTFQGPALKIIAHVLEGYDYVVRQTAAGEFEVKVIKLAGASKVISSFVSSPPQGYPATEANTGNPAVKGGPYPDPQWRARSYSRTMQPTTASKP